MTHRFATRFGPLVLTLGLACAGAAFAQGRPDPAALIAAQRDAMKALASMDGIWRGPAWTLTASGEKLNVTQTERIGPFLDGSVKVTEGKSYDSEGRSRFNAFGTISFDVVERAYRMHSHAQGMVGDFVFKPTADGYVWEIPAGPQATIRYTAVIKDGELFEVGDRIAPGQGALRIFEMRLKRVGDTSWPAGDAVPPK